ncbi:phage tail protein [uncultured Pseudomonas sp.]|uniref:phage tail-collar fiber domain-containing protein n=1 Tax=uncultured Pseudomonas sp. TaxID=114707 RepID=UPI0025FE05CD|nr:phage tail protein [uncultured Pseudomonas sp.]
MSQTYYAILTAIGEAKLANAAALNTTLKIAKMAVGDGGGAVPTPTRTQTALAGEWYRAGLNTLSVDPSNSSQIIAELVIPEATGGNWIREMGLYDSDGNLIAVANTPPSYKPQLAEGSGRTQVLRMILVVSSTSAVELKIDPSVILATRQYVDDAITVAVNRLDFKQSVRVATTANLTLSGTQTVDGVALVVGERVLVKDQATASANGLYIVAAGSWSRTSDTDSATEVTSGLLVAVEEGTTNADTLWQLVTDGPIVLGTTSLNFVPFYNGTQLAAMLDKKANINSPELVAPKRTLSPNRSSTSKELADVAYVEKVIGNRSSSSAQIYVSTALKPEMAGAIFQMCATSTVTITLPIVATCRIGDTFRFFSNTDHPFILKVSGSDDYIARGNLIAVKSLVLAPGESVELSVTDGINWFVTGGSLGAKVGAQINMSAFRAWNSVSQSISASTFTKLIYSTKTIDVLGEYNAARGEFTTTYDGLYEFSAAIHGIPSSNKQASRVLMLYANGAEISRLQEDTYVANQSAMCGTSGVVKLSAGDVVSFYYNTSIADDTYVDQALSWCSGRRVI